MNNSNNNWLVFPLSFLAIFMFMCFACFIFPFAIFFGVTSAILSYDSLPQEVKYDHYTGDTESSNKILKIDLTGVIMGEEPDSGFFSSLNFDGAAYGYSIKNQLVAAADQEDIKGVMIEVDSPGGTIFGSQAVYDGVEYYQKKTGNPVFAFVKGTSASGSYWSILPTNKIIADYGSSIGSIGVIFGPFKYYDTVLAEDYGAFSGGIVTQNGIETYYITAGQSKDLGDPNRELTKNELDVLQNGVDNEYANFVERVSINRDIDESVIREQIGALIYDNKSAVELNLIDETGNKDFAYNQLLDELKISGDDYQIVTQSRNVPVIGKLASAFGATPTDRRVETCRVLKTQILVYHGNVAEICY